MATDLFLIFCSQTGDLQRSALSHEGIHSIPLGCWVSQFFPFWFSDCGHPLLFIPQDNSLGFSAQMSKKWNVSRVHCDPGGQCSPLSLPSPAHSRLWQGWSALLINLPLSTFSWGNGIRWAPSISQLHSRQAGQKVSWHGDKKSQTWLLWRGSSGFHFPYERSYHFFCSVWKEKSQHNALLKCQWSWHP